MSKEALRLYKASVVVRGQQEEVPVWAADIEEAAELAQEEYGEFDRLRLVVNPNQGELPV